MRERLPLSISWYFLIFTGMMSWLLAFAGGLAALYLDKTMVQLQQNSEISLQLVQAEFTSILIGFVIVAVILIVCGYVVLLHTLGKPLSRLAQWLGNDQPEETFPLFIIELKDIRHYCVNRPLKSSYDNLEQQHQALLVREQKLLDEINKRHKFEDALLEAKQESDRICQLKSEFLANMSHEIRTPMNGLLGMLSMLRETPLNENQKDYADTAYSSGDNLLTLLNDILDISKIETNKLRLEEIDFDLRKVVEDVVELMAESAHKKQIDLATILSYEIPNLIVGDPTRLRQVLTNLVSNAIKFTEFGEIFISAKIQSQKDQMICLRFDVVDTGIGIDTDKQTYIFEPFAQADGSTTRKYGGTGLGLALAKQLTKLMGGTIGVDSSVGKGSAFWFTVELAQSQGPQTKFKWHPELAGRMALLLQESGINREVLQHHLTQWGMTLDCVTTADAAIETLKTALLANKHYDFFVMEKGDVKITTPNLALGNAGADDGGTEIMQAIRKDPSLQTTKMILLYSFVQNLQVDLHHSRDFKGLIRKPVRQSQLHEVLVTVLGLAREQKIQDNDTARDNESQSAREIKKPKYNTVQHHILLVEDNRVNQKVAVAYIKNLGLAVDVVENGQDAVATLDHSIYDLVLMDCQMPVMDGYKATAVIRKRDDANAHVPIIAMTANAMQGDREKCIAAGMDDYLSKPIKRDSLDDMLYKWLYDTKRE